MNTTTERILRSIWRHELKTNAAHMACLCVGLAAASGTISSARADTYVAGSMCQSLVEGWDGLRFDVSGEKFAARATGNSAGANVTCPIPSKDSLGDEAGFRFRVNDSSSGDNIVCGGYVGDSSGNLIAYTPWVESSGTGTQTLVTSVEVPNTANQVYAATCELPGTSRIYTIRAY